MVGAVEVSAERFEELVAEALDALPPWVRERMENVDVLIEDRPPPEQPGLLGLYEGVPLTRRGSGYFGAMPDRITLYRSGLARAVRSEQELRDLIRHTVGAVGFCMGGMLTLILAAQQGPKIGAAVAYYGFPSGEMEPDWSNLHAPPRPCRVIF